jgi:hypothetical protein
MDRPGAFRRSQLLFSAAAMLSFVASVALWFSDHKEQGLYVGLWVPSILSLGALLLAGRGGRP